MFMTKHSSERYFEICRYFLLKDLPSWHVNTVRCLLTPVHPGRTLIQILLAGFTHIAGSARTHTGRPAFAPIQTSLIAHRCKREN